MAELQASPVREWTRKRLASAEAALAAIVEGWRHAVKSRSWLKMPSSLREDSAPSASLDQRNAQATPAHRGAPPEQLEGSPWPQQPASGRPKV